MRTEDVGQSEKESEQKKKARKNKKKRLFGNKIIVRHDDYFITICS